MAPEVTTSPDASMVIKLTLDAFTAEKLLVTKPRSLPAATFCALLIEQALDKPSTLAERTEGSEASTSSLLDNTNKEKQSIKAVSAKKKRGRPAYSEEFKAFWNVYQSASHKATSQSKNKAFEQWKVALQDETPERLSEAARRAVGAINNALTNDEWCAPLPDAFRWLRDERYAVFLENHQISGPRIIDGITVID
jgi:hypothetical protein